MGEDSSEKTEEPTPHKLREARKKGQIAKSREVTAALLLFIAFYAFQTSAGTMWIRSIDVLHYAYNQIPEEFTTTMLATMGLKVIIMFFIMLAPMFIATFTAALFLEAIQTGFLFSTDPLVPNFSKLNPLEGFKKFFSMKQYVELFKTLVKMVIVVWIIFSVVKHEFSYILQSQTVHLWTAMVKTGQIVMSVAMKLGVFYIFLALIDLFYQRYEYMKTMKMSKKEIKEEYKRLEGDPLVKQRQRDAQRAMSMGRQMGQVPRSDVVVTNPTHIAVAISYRPNEMKAPMVVAKGKRLIAEEIKRIADEYYIPIIENPPIARGVYDSTPVGGTISPTYYKLVAEILAFVYNLKKKRSRRY